MHTITNPEGSRSVLATLRALVPPRAVSFTEALRIAELQASRLLELWDVQDGPVPQEVISELPRIRVVRVRDLPVSGSSHWSGSAWIIALSADEPPVRQRFTLMHEFKHILDHGRGDLLFRGTARHTPDEQAELVADYFAGCVLMPRRLLKRAWCEGLQAPSKVARRFAVSPRAADVRLSQVGLSEPRARCRAAGAVATATARRNRRTYFRRVAPLSARSLS